MYESGWTGPDCHECIARSMKRESASGDGVAVKENVLAVAQ
jgi:hypothetical protein